MIQHAVNAVRDLHLQPRIRISGVYGAETRDGINDVTRDPADREYFANYLSRTRSENYYGKPGYEAEKRRNQHFYELATDRAY
jgi:hypothetical protein